MRLPQQLLSSVRGPAIVVALAGCVPAAAPSVTIEPEPLVETTAFVAPDPISYDERAEAERLELADLDVGASADRRNRRIAANVAAARVPTRAPTNMTPAWAVRCGRG